MSGRGWGPPAEGVVGEDDPDDGLADRRCDLADRRCDDEALPGPRHRTGPLDCDRVPDWARKGVARSMGWLQQGRPIAAHHEKTAARDPGCVRCAKGGATRWLMSTGPSLYNWHRILFHGRPIDKSGRHGPLRNDHHGGTWFRSMQQSTS